VFLHGAENAVVMVHAVAMVMRGQGNAEKKADITGKENL
jgi:hypothetical protein